jgi:hypothetical protein
VSGNSLRLKALLKRVAPILRDRRVVTRLHSWTDRFLGLPAEFRLARMRRTGSGAAIVGRGNRRVVFVADHPLRREFKLAFALKRAGWDVLLLYRNAPAHADFSQFAAVQRFKTAAEALELALRAGARLFHCSSACADDSTIRIVTAKPGVVIYEPYDSFSGIAHGLPWAERMFSHDIARQSYCLARADAICTPDLQLAYGRAATGLARGKPLICFPNYCWNLQSLPEARSDHEIRIVQVGWMGFETRGEHDTGAFRVVREFVAAGCDFHLYLYPNSPPVGTAEFRRQFADYSALASETGRVHFHATVPPQQIVAELTQYDYGLNMINACNFDIPWTHQNPRWLRYVGSTRNFDYIDAGLGILIDGALSYGRRSFRGYGTVRDGTTLLRSGRIREILSQKPSREQLLAARAALSIERHIARLIRFYEALA